jgi:hypothetical protein
MKLARFLLVLAATALLAAVPYTDIRNAERSINRRFQNFSPSDPIEVLGSTLGLYVQGTGAVFNAEVMLVPAPGILPMSPAISKEEVAKLRERKRARLPELRQLMRDSLVSAAIGLSTLPAQEEVVFGVSMYYQPWEDTSGLPRQILLRARKQSLVDFERGTLKSLDTAIRMQEF